ncbi:DNA repair protein RadC [Psychromonas sp. B3M02]|uniref:JAB domain-containing protein n=1 Tax=Psychromonas sp. B3M02 TaxID=2267226 RepID=UPI000DEB2D61|nr:JAB domain-containing protein [Psychromonas sp. B3M02]RBW47309.1 DNA repair protein RadC [Psychromonas sp. B3M02]
MTNFTKKEQSAIDKAINIIESKAENSSFFATNAVQVKQYCQLKIGSEYREYFGVLFLNSQNELIHFEVLFKGGLDSASVHVDIVTKEALIRSSKNVIVCHNHPSGDVTPSQADMNITKKIETCLDLFDIRLLDHIIVSKINTFSFAEKGML